MPDYGPHMAVPGPPQMCPGPFPGPPPGSHYPPYPSPEFTRVDHDVPKGPFFNGATAPPPRQKGRPRKKKPKDQDIMTANLGELRQKSYIYVHANLKSLLLFLTSYVMYYIDTYINYM